ncbi:MAG: thiolase family protein [Pseudobdellovibrionaceae bacterium]
MENSVIVASTRTAIGSFQGALSSVTAPKLGAHVITAALQQIDLKPDAVQECILGQVLTAGSGQAPARQAAIYAGLLPSTVCLTINKVCGSGLKAVMLAADSIRTGQSEVVLAGGQENMTLSPHLMENSRAGYRMGHVQMADSMIKDGLWDPYNNWHMGSAAEICSKDYSFTREQQDEFAIQSYKKAQKAIESGLFKKEIAAFEIQTKKGTQLVEKDEDPFNTNFEKIPGLKPAFEKTGTITAANASKINDGAAVQIIMSESQAKKRNLKPLAKIVAYATFAQDPKYFTTAPVGAMKKVLQMANLSATKIDLFEINEAFACVTMAAMKDLEIPMEKINPHGGAIAIGHPIGASGSRILTTLVHGLHTHNKKYGMASICIGGGEAVAMIIERI